MEKEKTSAEQKSEYIQKFSAALTKHCKDAHDVERVIIAITSFNEFMDGISSWRHNIVSDIHFMRKIINENSQRFGKDIICSFETVADDFVMGMILSNQCCYGMDLISEMDDDLQEIPGL